MNKIKRIAIIGNAGSGKSTLAVELHKIFKLSLYHLDQHFWGPNWAHPNIDEYKIIHDSICDKDEWIIDGMNLRFLDYRAARADMIIFLDVPRYKCFWRIFKRMFKYYGKQAPSSAKDCREGFNSRTFAFLKWVWNFKKRYPDRIDEILQQYKNQKQIYVIKSQKDLDQLLSTFKSWPF